MSKMNPYAKNLGDRDALTVLIETPDRLEALAARIGPAGMKRSYEEGKWNLARILFHRSKPSPRWPEPLSPKVETGISFRASCSLLTEKSTTMCFFKGVSSCRAAQRRRNEQPLFY